MLFCSLIALSSLLWFSPRVSAFPVAPRAISFSKYSLVRASAATTSTDGDGGGDSLIVGSPAWTEKRNQLAKHLLDSAREIGQVGMKTTEGNRRRLDEIAQQLAPYTDPAPARVPLTGVHELVYSASTSGPPAGKVGPFVGRVTQTFVDDVVYENAVRLWGPVLRVSILADREVLDDVSIRVTFFETTVRVFGIPLVKRAVSGRSGVWKQLFVGEVEVGNERMLLRVMETPKLFIIKQNLT